MDKEAFSRYERRVRALAGFGHRGSATEGARRAAKYLAEELRALGLAPEEERFSGSRSLGARLLVHIGVAAVGALLLRRRPRLGAALGALALGSLIREQSTRGSLLSRPLTRAESFNVAARLPARPGPAKGRVIVCGHYDTQRTGFIWIAWRSRLVPLLSRTLLQSPFFPVTAAMGVQCLAGAVAGLGVGRALVGRVAGLLGLVYAVAAALLADWAASPYVPGASDNASGAAAVFSLGELWLAEPTARVEVVLLFTGSEETGLLGAAAWADRHREEIRSLPTFFLNLDGLGCGMPRFLGCEVPIAGPTLSYPRPLIRRCRQLARDMGLVHAEPQTTFGPTDGLAFLARRIPGVTVIGCDDQGLLPEYHRLTDTPERMDFHAAWRGVQFAARLLRQLADIAGEAVPMNE